MKSLSGKLGSAHVIDFDLLLGIGRRRYREHSRDGDGGERHPSGQNTTPRQPVRHLLLLPHSLNELYAYNSAYAMEATVYQQF